MNEIIIDSYGKINLGLDIIGKRPDGYHNINTIFQEIDISDRLIISLREDDSIKITSNRKEVPLDDTNLVYKAWQLMKDRSKLNIGVNIHIEKNIPIAGGLAGGSTNAAGLLKALNILWDLDYSLKDLRDLGVEIGADVPFCLEGGSLFARGIGEVFEDVSVPSGINILLVNPNIPINTAYVYSKIEFKEVEESLKIKKLRDSLGGGDLKDIGNNLYNKMEEVVIKEYRIIGEIKDKMMDLGSLGSLMSGSGASVFGIFSTNEDLNRAYKELKTTYPTYYVEKTKTR